MAHLLANLVARVKALDDPVSLVNVCVALLDNLSTSGLNESPGAFIAEIEARGELAYAWCELGCLGLADYQCQIIENKVAHTLPMRVECQVLASRSWSMLAAARMPKFAQLLQRFVGVVPAGTGR